MTPEQFQQLLEILKTGFNTIYPILYKQVLVEAFTELFWGSTSLLFIAVGGSPLFVWYRKYKQNKNRYGWDNFWEYILHNDYEMYVLLYSFVGLLLLFLSSLLLTDAFVSFANPDFQVIDLILNTVK